MSGPSPAAPLAIPPPDPPHLLQPWQKAGIWALLGAALFAALFVFSGKISIPFLGQKQAPAEQPMTVRKETNAAPLTHPTASRPDYAPGGKKPNGNQSYEQARLEAASSPIQAFGNHMGGGAPGAVPPEASEHPAPGSPAALEASLTPTTLVGTRVAELPDPTWTISAGRILPCNQQTKIDTTLSSTGGMLGMVTAVIPEEIRSETANVVLLDKGSKVFGTVRGALLNGANRVAVLWEHIDSPVMYDRRGMPHRYRIKVDSPAAGDLGETGLDVDVNRHLGLKIGGIIGYSLLQTGGQYLIAEQQAKSNGTQINLNSFQQGGNQAADTLLNAWVSIPDVGTRDQGLHCSLDIVRDLDMYDIGVLRRKWGLRS